MNRREIAVNVLLGSVLLLSFAAPFAGVAVAAGFAFHFLNLAVRHFFPSLALLDAQFYIICCAWSLITAIQHFRQRRWLFGLMSLAMIAMIASVWLAVPQTELRDNPFFVWPCFVVFFTSRDYLPTRTEFTLIGFAVGATIAVNAGLLGTGTLTRWTADSIWIPVFALTILYFRRELRKGTNPESPSFAGTLSR